MKLCVVGAGRVGLPFALFMASRGIETILLERNEARLESIQNRESPFEEPGVAQALKATTLVATDNPEVVSEADVVSLSVGTPLGDHLEPDLSQLTGAILQIAPYTTDNHLIMLRSTVPPGTTEALPSLAAAQGQFLRGELAFCPERVAEGHVLRELAEFPQIVGAETRSAHHKARDVFGRAGLTVLETTIATAEFTKLYNNTARYIEFAIANEMFMKAESMGISYNEVRRLATFNYSRGFAGTAGFTAGACLRKDFALLEEGLGPGSYLPHAAWRVNESVPTWLVSELRRRTNLTGARVLLLGTTFKPNSDDKRDSLAIKLSRLLARAGAIVREFDPADEPPTCDPLARVREAISKERPHCVVVGAPHDVWRDQYAQLSRLLPADCWIADIWSLWGYDRVFWQVGDMP